MIAFRQVDDFGVERAPVREIAISLGDIAGEQLRRFPVGEGMAGNELQDMFFGCPGIDETERMSAADRNALAPRIVQQLRAQPGRIDIDAAALFDLDRQTLRKMAPAKNHAPLILYGACHRVPVDDVLDGLLQQVQIGRRLQFDPVAGIRIADQIQLRIDLIEASQAKVAVCGRRHRLSPRDRSGTGSRSSPAGSGRGGRIRRRLPRLPL